MSVKMLKMVSPTVNLLLGLVGSISKMGTNWKNKKITINYFI
jgi:hypothetical protein